MKPYILNASTNFSNIIQFKFDSLASWACNVCVGRAQYRTQWVGSPVSGCVSGQQASTHHPPLDSQPHTEHNTTTPASHTHTHTPNTGWIINTPPGYGLLGIHTAHLHVHTYSVRRGARRAWSAMSMMGVYPSTALALAVTLVNCYTGR